MKYKILTIAIFTFLIIQPGWAQEANEPPVVGFGGTLEIKEQGQAPLTGVASDPENDPLTYSWEITSDPTGQAFFRLPGGASAGTAVAGTLRPSVGLAAGPIYPNPSYVGQGIEVTLTVSDGVNVSTATRTIMVTGVNREPIIVVDRSQLGTPSNPRKPPEGIGLNAQGSYDPDDPNEPVKMLWRVAKIVGQTCFNNNDIVLLGKETENPGFVVPPNMGTLQNPVEVTFELILEDGLIFKQPQYKGYMYDPNGCGGGGGNPRPVLSVAASTTHAAFGQTVTMTANVTDPGDTHTYSWVRLDSTGGPSIQLSTLTGRTTSFTAPGVPAFLRFQVTATDSVGQSDTKTIQIQVSQSGGGSGGTGGGGTGGGTGGGSQAGTGSGTPAAPQRMCSSSPASTNNPPTARVDNGYTIDGGNRATLTATNVSDPDGPNVFIPGVNTTGPVITYEWSIIDGGGFLTTNMLSGRMTASVSFDTPYAGGNARLRLVIKDGAECGNAYDVNVVVRPAPSPNNNTPPTARLRYRVGTAQEVDAPTSVTLTAPGTVNLSAATSSDDDTGDTLAFSWKLETQLAGWTLCGAPPGANLCGNTSAAALVVPQSTQGTAVVTVTVSDGKGGSNERSVTFNYQPGPPAKPVKAVAKVLNTPNGSELDGAVGPGKAFVLSGGQSYVEGGTSTENAALSYLWEYVSGPPRFDVLNSANVRDSEIKVSVDALSQISTLTYQLTVSNGTTSDTQLVAVTVDPALAEIPGEEFTGEVYFPRVGFGPLPNGQFQTVLTLVNPSDEPVEFSIEFFDQEGAPIPVQFLDTDVEEPTVRMWDSSQPATLEGGATRKWEFQALEGEPLRAGWAVARASSRLEGYVDFQLVDDVTGGLTSVAAEDAAAGASFRGAYRYKDNLAFAITNPGDQLVEVAVTLTDRNSQGRETTERVIVQPGGHVAMWLADQPLEGGGLLEGLFPALNLLANRGQFREGNIELKVEGEGTIVPTALLTESLVAISAQPLVKIR